MPYSVTMSATVGGAGQDVTLNFDAKDHAYFAATALASSLEGTTAITGMGDLVTASTISTLIIAPDFGAENLIADRFAEIIIGQVPETLVVAGVDPSLTRTQTIVTGDAGLNLTYTDNPDYAVAGDSPVMLYVGGGTNDISFLGSNASAGIFLAGGDNKITAGSGATTINAGTGANSIFAGSSSALIQVAGADTISLSTGATTVSVPAAGSALVFSNSGPLLFIGGTSASTVVGGTGSETVYAGAGGGSFTGGAGTNDLVGATDGAGGQPGVGSPVTLTGGGSECNYIQGDANGDDVLNSGNSTAATLVSEGPGDTINAGSGAATIVLDAKSGVDTVNLGAGAATVSLPQGAGAVVYGGSGRLTFLGYSASSTVIAGTGSGDSITGGPGGGSFAGGSDGNNTIIGGAGSVTLFGASGVNSTGDYLEANGPADSMVAGTGNDTLLASAVGADTLVGGIGDDKFFINRDTLSGASSGNAYLISNYHVGDIVGLVQTDIPADGVALNSAGIASLTLTNGVKVTIQGTANIFVSFAEEDPWTTAQPF